MKQQRNNIYFIGALYLHWEILYGIFSNISILFFRYERNEIILMNKCVLMLFILLLCLLILKKNGIECILIGLVWIVLCFLTLIITPDFVKIFPKTFFYSISYMIIPIFLVTQFRDYNKLQCSFIPYIYLGIIYSILQWRVFLLTNQYNMQYSYQIVIPGTLSLLLSIYKKQKRFFLIFSFFFLVNLFCGSRGSIICYVIALIFVFFVFVDLKKQIVRVIFLIPGFTLLINILQKLSIILSKYFIKSRTIQLFADGNFFYMSGRGSYYSFILNQIVNEPFKIRGIYSDRIYLGNYFHRTDSASIFGSYSHNFFLEILFQFGVWGIPFILYCLAIIIYSTHIVKRHNNESIKIIYIIFASYCIGQLLFSASYLTVSSFGIFAGLNIALCSKNRKNNYEEN